MIRIEELEEERTDLHRDHYAQSKAVDQILNQNARDFLRKSDGQRLTVLAEQHFQVAHKSLEQYSEFLNSYSDVVYNLANIKTELEMLSVNKQMDDNDDESELSRKKKTNNNNNNKRTLRKRRDRMESNFCNSINENNHHQCSSEMNQMEYLHWMEQQRIHQISLTALETSLAVYRGAAIKTANHVMAQRPGMTSSFKIKNKIQIIPEFDGNLIWNQRNLILIRGERGHTCTEPFIQGIFIRMVHENQRQYLIHPKTVIITNQLNWLVRNLIELLGNVSNHSKKMEDPWLDFLVSELLSLKPDIASVDPQILLALAIHKPLFLPSMRIAWIYQYRTDLAIGLKLMIEYFLLTDDDEIAAMNPFDDYYRDQLIKHLHSDPFLYPKFLVCVTSKEYLIDLVNRSFGESGTINNSESIKKDKVITMNQLGIALIEFSKEYHHQSGESHLYSVSDTVIKQAVRCFQLTVRILFDECPYMNDLIPDLT